MFNQAVQLEVRILKLLDELEQLPSGAHHIRTCPKCRVARGYLRGITMLNEDALGVYEAHLLAVKALLQG